MYETGTYGSISDLWTAFRVFAAAAGWTVHAAASDGYVFEKNGVFVAGNVDGSGGFRFRGCLGFNGALDAFAQPGNSGTSHNCNVPAGAGVAYHFYAVQEEGKDLLAAIVEFSAGIYRHWIISNLIKYGNYTGGTYTDSVNWSTATTQQNQPDSFAHRSIADTVGSSSPHGQVWVDHDNKNNNWQFINVASTFTQTFGIGSTRSSSINARQRTIGWPRFNERLVGQPVELFVNRASSLRSPIGRVPCMRSVNMTNYTPGELVVIGSDTWQLFPIVQRTTTFNQVPSSVPSSGLYGYAYRR